MINKALFTSNSENWETPEWLFEELNKEFNFELDVCANIHNTKCNKFYTKEHDSLSKSWSEYRCWMNPPYGRTIGKWIKKAFESNTLVVCLLPARTDTKWLHQYIYNNAEIRFIKGRLKFSNSKNSAPFPSMIVVFKGKKG